MQRSQLSLYIKKYKEGDVSYTERLCSQLADRLVFVPVPEAGIVTDPQSLRTKVKVIRVTDERGKAVPVFTSSERFHKWSLSGAGRVESVSLLGGDFCATLDTHTSLLLDEGSDESVKIPPLLVKKIGDIALTDSVKEGRILVPVVAKQNGTGVKKVGYGIESFYKPKIDGSDSTAVVTNNSEQTPASNRRPVIRPGKVKKRGLFSFIFGR